jgi:hypothetical protein
MYDLYAAMDYFLGLDVAYCLCFTPNKIATVPQTTSGIKNTGITPALDVIII